MNILSINGSPRHGGNTDVLIDKALEGVVSKGAEVDRILLRDLDISPCREAEYEMISDNGLSVIEDDIYVVFEKLKKCDAIIIGSPIFFGSVSAQLKTMIDRFQCVWVAKNIEEKVIFPKSIKGAFISVQATGRKDFFDNAESIIRHFFTTVNAEYVGKIFCPGVDAKGSVLAKPDMLKEAYRLGQKLADLE